MLMLEVVVWFDGTSHDDSLHPLLAIGIFVVAFLAIHPLQYGNGRLGRVRRRSSSGPAVFCSLDKRSAVHQRRRGIRWTSLGCDP
ncbi:hypothetical protein CKO23_20785 [Thiocystis violacea]|nr:hypothetical protein [Thiocystis violacea]